MLIFLLQLKGLDNAFYEVLCHFIILFFLIEFLSKYYKKWLTIFFY